MTPDLGQLPGIALQDDTPVFTEPWEAQAFAMAVHLHARGAFTWEEWAACLSSEIHGGEERSYYGHWLAALERIVAEKALTSLSELSDRKEDWHAAATRTPHGDPIVL